jgi:hypothetical protein
MPDFLVLSDKGVGKKIFTALAASGDVKQEDFEKRFVLWTNLYTGILNSYLSLRSFRLQKPKLPLELDSLSGASVRQKLRN